MRPTADHPRRPRHPRRFAGRGRAIAIGVVVLLILLIVSLRGIARFYTDYLWFKSLHLTGVWSGVLGAKLALAAIFIVLFFALMLANLLIADRVAPAFVPGPEEELLARYRDLVGKRTALIRVIVSAVFAVIAGAGVSSQWNDWVLFTHAKRFGIKDATFHTDVGFYVFKLPFLTFLGSWLFAALVIIILVTTVAHYLNGGIRVRAPRPEVGPQVKAHLSVLLGVLALVKGYQYWLQRYQLTFSQRGTVNGALYTDSKIELKALYLLMAIAVFALALFIVNIWRRGFVLPVIAVGMWALVAVLAGAVVPWFVQRFRVQPAESHVERPYISENIAATRHALGLDKITVRNYDPTGALTPDTVVQNAATVRNIRLWDPQVMQTVFGKLQAQQPYYEVNNVDVDRYRLGPDQESTQVLVGNRDLNTSGVPQSSWEATHLAYTHGYGTIMAPANANDAGNPAFTLQNIPTLATQGAPQIRKPDLYIGEGLSGFVIVNTGRSEVDYTDQAGKTVTTQYKGKDGVKIGGGLGGFVNRASFALRFLDTNTLISSNIKPKSKILINRDVMARLQAAAPFISFDGDPYPVVLANGHVVYIADGYTTTKHYPNAQTADTSDVPAGSGLDHDFNYARNSVKAVIDAYDGTVKLYVIDPSDPLIAAYRSAFPKLFTSASKASDDLRSHFRYPEDLFRVQTTMYGRYHLTNPDDFYNNNNAWTVALDPNIATGKAAAAAPTANGEAPKETDRMAPDYLLTKLPDQNDESFLIFRPFVPVATSGSSDSRQQLTGFMAAQSDLDDYGRMTVYKTSTTNLPDGPRLIADQMVSNPVVSQQQTLLCQQGAQCQYGATFLVPIGNSLLYVRSLYVGAENNGLPQLKQVIVANQSNDTVNVSIDPTLYGAMSRLLCPGASQDPNVAAPNCGLPTTREAGINTGSGTAGTPTSPTPTPLPATPTAPGVPTAPNGLSAGAAAQVRTMLSQLQAALADGRAAFGRGDYTTYAADQTKVDQLAQQLQTLLGGASSGSTAGTPGGTSPPASSTPSTTPPAQPTTTLTS